MSERPTLTAPPAATAAAAKLPAKTQPPTWTRPPPPVRGKDGVLRLDAKGLNDRRERLVDKDARIADQAAVIDDLRARLDREAEERRRLIAVLTDQRGRPPWWRRWFR